MRVRGFVSVLLIVILGAMGCGGEKQVGSEDLLKFKQQEDPKRVGAIERESPSPSPMPSPSPPPAAAKPPPPPPPQAAEKKAPTVVIEITAQGYKPFNLRVFKGTTLKLMNKDSQARTFTSDQAGVFDSGMIAPGAAWEYVTNQIGEFNFHDETRPYVVGKLEVVPQ